MYEEIEESDRIAAHIKPKSKTQEIMDFFSPTKTEEWEPNKDMENKMMRLASNINQAYNKLLYDKG